MLYRLHRSKRAHTFFARSFVASFNKVWSSVLADEKESKSLKEIRRKYEQDGMAGVVGRLSKELDLIILLFLIQLQKWKIMWKRVLELLIETRMDYKSVRPNLSQKTTRTHNYYKSSIHPKKHNNPLDITGRGFFKFLSLPKPGFETKVTCGIQQSTSLYPNEHKSGAYNIREQTI